MQRKHQYQLSEKAVNPVQCSVFELSTVVAAFFAVLDLRLKIYDSKKRKK